MRAVGPGEIAVWQWFGLVIAIAVSWMLGRVVMAAVAWLARVLASRTSTTFDDELLARLRSPLRVMASIALLRSQLPVLELHHELATSFLLAAFALALVWGALRGIDVATTRLTTARWASSRPASRALLLLLGRIAKVIVVVIAGIGFLSGLGLPVASLLAGLGIGGIALAFGAQKTVENLFGAVAIGIDQPLREGDFVKIEQDVLGTVEAVGLRSTRVRTLDRTVVTLPNGRLADMRVETYAVRDRCRLATIIGLAYGTTAEQLRAVLAGFEQVLRAHPGIWPDDVIVRFSQFGSSSLDVEVMAWFRTGDWGQFRAWRQEVLIGFMDVVERAGTSFALPMQALRVTGDLHARIAREGARYSE
ncbi:MAG TPA: mechanosensitive ion channel family protein [Kofleriaceae bacterium]|nr:mechanosensitive ion channel family protein [Kofleriaceae bacterium]